MNYKYTFMIILVLLLLFRNKFNNNNYSFWNKEQPVYTKLKEDGIIKNICDLKTILPTEDLHIYELTEINVLIEFLNKNFDNYIIYTPSYLQYLLGKNYILYGLYKNNELIGTISGRYTVLNISNNKYKTTYVDNLCIKKEYRNKNYSPLLISAIINNMKKQNHPIAYHRSDNKKHHFKHCYETSYYYKKIKDIHKNFVFDIKLKNNISSIKLNISNDTLMKVLYSKYKKSLIRYKLYENIVYNDFEYILKNNDVKTFIFRYNNILIGFITYIELEYDINKNKESVIELIYFNFFDEKYIEYIDHIINNFYEIIYKRYKYITLLENFYNKNLINKWKLDKTETSYFYLYNYYIKNKFKHENCFI